MPIGSVKQRKRQHSNDTYISSWYCSMPIPHGNVSCCQNSARYRQSHHYATETVANLDISAATEHSARQGGAAYKLPAIHMVALPLLRAYRRGCLPSVIYSSRRMASALLAHQSAHLSSIISCKACPDWSMDSGVKTLTFGSSRSNQHLLSTKCTFASQKNQRLAQLVQHLIITENRQ